MIEVASGIGLDPLTPGSSPGNFSVFFLKTCKKPWVSSRFVPDFCRAQGKGKQLDKRSSQSSRRGSVFAYLSGLAEGSAALAELFLVILGFVMMATRRETPKWWWKKGPKDGADQPIPSGKPTKSY